MKRWKRTLVVGAAELAGLLALHAVLLRVMADREIVASILAAGDHVPRLTLACAGLFLGVRFLAVFALPGLILARLGLVAVDWYLEYRAGLRAGPHRSGSVPIRISDS